jgi:hypothetical protein
MTVLEGTWTKRLTNRPGITREPRFGEFGSQIFFSPGRSFPRRFLGTSGRTNGVIRVVRTRCFSQGGCLGAFVGKSGSR